MGAFLNFRVGDPHGRVPVMVFFKGGGPSSPPKQQKVKLPKAPDPLPPPPPTEYRPDVGQTTMDLRAREARKKGIGATLLAGETANAGGKRTLLG